MTRPSDTIILRVLNKTATEQQAAEVAAWFATDQGQAWLSEQMERDAAHLLDGTTPLADHTPLEEPLRRIDRTISRMRRRRLLLRIAAVLIPCALVVGMWVNLNSRMGGILFSTPATEQTVAVHGERKEIIFQDGSKIFLNAGTQIFYPSHFGLSERRVELDGEAYFEVTPNPRRPFVVQIGDAAIRVLGTSFNAKAYACEKIIDVVLIEGTVEFTHGDKQYLMHPSQRLVYDKTTGKGELYADTNANHEALWRKNIISFRDTPLREVITTLERWYDVKFEVLDEAAFTCTFSLQTTQLPLVELLGEMEKIAPLRYRTATDSNRVFVDYTK